MKKLILLFIYTSATIVVHGQGFFVDGYLLYGKDTTKCRLWYEPGNFNFNDSLTIWADEKSSAIALNKKDNLVGLGITHLEYKSDYGKIRLQGTNSLIYSFAKKLVTGTVELYELPITVMKKDPSSLKLIKESFSDYYITRTDNDKFEWPVFIKQLKKKKIADFIFNFPGLKEIKEDMLFPEQAVALVKEYNEWFKNNKALK